MNDAGLGNSPTPDRPFDVTDEQLSAELKQWTGGYTAGMFALAGGLVVAVILVLAVTGLSVVGCTSSVEAKR